VRLVLAAAAAALALLLLRLLCSHVHRVVVFKLLQGILPLLPLLLW
jgi:hypothetical protein